MTEPIAPIEPAAPVLLGDRLAHWAATTPDAPAVTFEEHTYTWAQWHGRVRRLTGALAALGVGRGDRVAFLDRNHLGCVETTFAAAALGAANAVLNWRLAADELDYVINHSGAKVLFVGHELAPTVAGLRARLDPGLLVLTVGGGHDEYEPLVATAAALDPPPPDPEEPCLVMYSSGTTGRPKGVLLNHRAMVAHTVGLITKFPAAPGDLNLVAMPLFHVGGSSYILLGVHVGMPSYLARDADGPTLFAAIAAGATHAFVVPAVVGAVFAAGEQAVAAFGRLRFLAYGASPMPLPLLRKALAAWPAMDFMQVYGMTELCGVVVTLDPDAHRDTAHPQRLASAGRPVDAIAMRVVDPETREDVAVGEAGELWFRGPHVMKGYLDDPAATAQTITVEGWLRSGDIGWCDDGGFVTISDRVKDMIITGGENVYSPEVENAIAEHEAVAEVAVIGIPDEKWGEAVRAVVALHPGAEVAAEDLIAWTRQRIAAYKSPRSVEFVAALPRNPTGKILKRTLREPHWTGRPRAL